MADEERPQRDEFGRFLPGNSGSPGRPKGARHKLSQDFLTKLAADFEEHGEAAIRHVREEDPTQYLKVIASLVPKEINFADTPADDGLSTADLEREIVDLIVEARRAEEVARSARGKKANGSKGGPSQVH